MSQAIPEPYVNYSLPNSINLSAITDHHADMTQGCSRCCDVPDRTDNEWHHVALTWLYDSGETQLFYDGEAQVPFLRSQAGQLDMRDAKDGGVSSILAPRTSRAAEGVLGD